MKKEDLKIVYMGTPDFAVEPLQKLVEGGYNIVGVITMPDKPIGRHQNELSASPVKKYAVEQGLRVLQPAKLKDPDFIEELRSLHADLQIVVAFRMLPEVVWNMPPYGTFNLHAALLPQYRGAAPINWAIINGDTETGITTFFLDHDIDTGNIIQRVPVPILDTDNVEDVHDKLMHLGGDLVLETVDNIIANNVHPIPQSKFTTNAPLRPAPKIFKETCRIDWTKDVKRTYDFVRGLSPYPAAWTELSHNNKTSVLKIYATKKEFCDVAEPIGSIITDGKTYFKVAQSNGYQHLLTIQLAGKKRMQIVDFLRGFHADSHISVK
ncbi:MAG: methionyl-tRNA formyltransferase [Prevotella sp.]|nr:methionyl-tRNA formyltransferase [Prevotella sp.]MDY5666429.1 methionyl-tRNA formyltransferase [Alloprevotella sp.]